MQKLLLDMDGVLVNFIKGACHAHKVTNPYDNGSNLGKWDAFDMDIEKFYEPMDFDFWSNLEWMPDGQKILEVIEQRFLLDSICILSKPCKTRGSIDGKIAWLEKHAPNYSRRFLIGTEKKFCASENNILIDDSDANINDFVEHGGIGILIPRPWNAMHDMKICDVPEYLEMRLDALC